MAEEKKLSRKELLELLRQSKNREVMSDYIRIGTSDLYDYDVTRRAVLREIAFLQQNNDKKKTPEDSPFHGDYVGWCWASQRYIAGRVGTTDDYVHECVKLFEKDGVIRVREWEDSFGYPHSEYQIISEVVEAHQRPEGWIKEERKRPRRGGNTTANKGSFKPGNKAAARKTQPSSQPFPSESTAVSHPSPQPLPTGLAAVPPTEFTAVSDTAANPSKGVDHTGGSASVASLLQPLGGFDLGGDTTASNTASSAPPAADAGRERQAASVAANAKAKPEEANGSLPEQNQKPKRPTGTLVKGERKPLPNRLCYPDAFKDWKPGMRVPKCKKCGGNLQPNENHACPGYIEQLPFKDMPAHIERMQDQREEHHELIANGRSLRRKPECKRCGEPLLNEEHAMQHTEECRGYMSL
jgi:hypothetical protein